ncbi:MAG: hypothetical protein AAGB15_04665 [Pseudomonadota bacterium]
MTCLARAVGLLAGLLPGLVGAEDAALSREALIDRIVRAGTHITGQERHTVRIDGCVMTTFADGGSMAAR